MHTPELKQPVRQVIELLVEQKYSELESLTKKTRLSAQDIRQAIAAYNEKLIMPPDGSYRLMSVVRVRGAEPPKWSVAMPLWTENEGRSDLSIELTIIKQEGGFLVELDDIQVN